LTQMASPKGLYRSQGPLPEPERGACAAGPGIGGRAAGEALSTFAASGPLVRCVPKVCGLTTTRCGPLAAPRAARRGLGALSRTRAVPWALGSDAIGVLEDARDWSESSLLGASTASPFARGRDAAFAVSNCKLIGLRAAASAACASSSADATGGERLALVGPAATGAMGASSGADAGSTFAPESAEAPCNNTDSRGSFCAVAPDAASSIVDMRSDFITSVAVSGKAINGTRTTQRLLLIEPPA